MEHITFTAIAGLQLGTERLGNSIFLWAECALLTFYYYGSRSKLLLGTDLFKARGSF